MQKFIITIVCLVVLVISVTIYLSPDDLKGCGKKPLVDQPGRKCQDVDAVVAISGGDTKARTAEAIKLYHNGWAKYLIFSGAAADKTGPSNADVMKEQAIAAGVPEDVIFVEGDAKTTRENAILTQKIFTSKNVKKIILVTSSYHQRRASVEFKRNISSDITLYNHPVPNDAQWTWYWWATPYGWQLAVSEIVKIIMVYMGASK